MNKDTAKDAIDDIAGRTKRQIGEWTGDTNAQTNGGAQQVKGKAEKAWGIVKGSLRDVTTISESSEHKAIEHEREENERKHREATSRY